MFRGASRFPFGLTASLMILLLVTIVAGAAQSCSQTIQAPNIRSTDHAAGQQ